jgi:hypothetical protein
MQLVFRVTSKIHNILTRMEIKLMKKKPQKEILTASKIKIY